MAPATIELTETAKETLETLEPTDRERVRRKLVSVADFPEHYLDGLRGVPGYALRIGDFRLIVDWQRDSDVLYVVAILERKHDYRELGKLNEIWGAWRE